MRTSETTRHSLSRSAAGDPVLTITLAGRRDIDTLARGTASVASLRHLASEVTSAFLDGRNRTGTYRRDGVEKTRTEEISGAVETIVLVGWDTTHRLAFAMLGWRPNFAAMGCEILRAHLHAIGPDAWKDLWTRTHGTDEAPMDLTGISTTATPQPLAAAARTLQQTLYQDAALPQPFEEHDTVVVSAQALHTVLCSLKLAAPPTRVEFVAQNIVNQLGDLWEIPVDVRQATNDRCDTFVAGLIRTTHPSREITGHCGDLGCRAFMWGEFPGIDDPVLLCTAHRMPAPGWAYEEAVQR
ncbi:hypothetical protein ACFV9C_42690 [Kribbella sp. NPDC059898]|uniref:hypothetical protein n=1 Tax=Kribbella sp. NPDC059898 TaxID=3346995 RepID=UPI0036566833